MEVVVKADAWLNTTVNYSVVLMAIDSRAVYEKAKYLQPTLT